MPSSAGGADAALLRSPVALGAIHATNRVVMAPMTRSRAEPDGCPHPAATTYYAQRAGAGLIVTEGTCISPRAVGNPGVPGIWSTDQVRAWQGVTHAVHEAGGRIVLQLWHTGRASDPVFQPGDLAQVGPSAVGIAGRTYTSRGWVEFKTPRALELAEVAEAVSSYADGARRAIQAGFDGVEIHAANGYLIDQFLQTSANQRTDRYGGAIEHRTRFLGEVVEAVADAVGASRTGVRLSPSSSFYDMHDPEREELFAAAIGGLPAGELAYLHIVEPGISGSTSVATDVHLDSAWVRRRWTGRLVAAGDYTAQRAAEALASGTLDAVAFGRLFVANPDLPARLISGAPLNVPHRETFYGGGDEGYLDYPTLDARA